MHFKVHYIITIWLWCLSSHTLASIIIPKEPIIGGGSITLSDLNEIRRDLDQKITAVNNLAILIDANIKSLQEKAHVWDLYRHHIDAWNDQMKSLDHKIDLIKYNQDEGKIVETKLTSMEFLINHILSKIMLHLDGPNNSASDGKKNETDGKQIEIIIKLLKENKSTQRELTNRMNNVLRHVLSIENSNCRTIASSKSTNSKNNKSGNLMKPVGRDTDSILRNVESKLDEFIGTLKPKDLKQFMTTEKKNTKTLDEVLLLQQNVAEIVRGLAKAEADNSIKFMNCCSSTMNELSTFTESSDLLLKRIERLVLNIQEKVDKVAMIRNTTSIASNDDNNNDDDDDNMTTEMIRIVLEESTTYEEIISTSGSNNPAYDVETIEEFESTESVEADYVQPSKYGCHDLTVRADGVYKFSGLSDVNDAGRDFNERYCAFPTDGPGWTVIQRRGPYEHQENFNRSWVEYKNGFGSMAKDFWFGNEFIHRLTYNSTELRIELEDFDDVKVWAEYSIFQVDSEKLNYNLLIGGYRGAVTDSMLYHHMQDFSTYDRRNDKSLDECCPCATGYGSGWWYDNCSEANLNGIYHSEPNGHNYIGVVWEHWHGDYSLRKTRMLIRPTIVNSAFGSNENNAVELPDDP